jgi:hypothetical protein
VDRCGCGRSDQGGPYKRSTSVRLLVEPRRVLGKMRDFTRYRDMCGSVLILHSRRVLWGGDFRIAGDPTGTLKTACLTLEERVGDFA